MPGWRAREHVSGAMTIRWGAKFLLHKFARRVDQALHGVLADQRAPLVLAADEPLASMFRSINT